MLVHIIIFVLLCSCSFQDEHEQILCRNCGNVLLNSTEIIFRKSEASLHHFNTKLFSTHQVDVQILERDLFFQFPTITSNHSNCIGFGEWEEQELWYPGYLWKPCLCPECGVLVGWIFKNQYSEDSQFFALILPNLLGEKLLKSLIVYPI